MKFIVPALVFAFLIFPSVTLAQGGLVPCNGPDCTTCHAVQLANNVVNFLITILSVLAVIVMVYAGFKMVISGGNTEAWEDAKKKFFNVIIGFIIVLAAWLIVDTILEVLTDQGLDAWGSVLCEDPGGLALVASATTNTNTNNNQQDNQSPVGGGVALSDSAAREQLDQVGIHVWESAPGRTSLEGNNQATIDEAIYLKQSCGCPVTVTGGTESGHAPGTYSHSNGYKIDLDDSGGLTNYIKTQGTYEGMREEGVRTYSLAGRPNVEYALEDDHWDITVK